MGLAEWGARKRLHPLTARFAAPLGTRGLVALLQGRSMDPYPAKHVANNILSFQWDRDGYPSISPMKLQKLMYVVHGWHLAIHGEPAVKGGFDAWTYGPVNEETYHAFKKYGRRAISLPATESTPDGDVAYIVSRDRNKLYEVLNMVMGGYERLSASRLSRMTHSPGSPWQKTKDAGKYHIDDELIRRHYVHLANSVDDPAEAST